MVFVPRDADGLTITPIPTLGGEETNELHLDGVRVPADALLGHEGGGWLQLMAGLNYERTILAATALGLAQRAFDDALAYAKERRQFGRPIGSFQAIKHKCADMLLEVESSKSAAYYAGWAAAEDNDELPVVASLAKSYCSEAYFHAAAENIQIHGGIGFTWEHDAHLYLKRLLSWSTFLGGPDRYLTELGARLVEGL